MELTSTNPTATLSPIPSSTTQDLSPPASPSISSTELTQRVDQYVSNTPVFQIHFPKTCERAFDTKLLQELSQEFSTLIKTLSGKVGELQTIKSLSKLNSSMILTLSPSSSEVTSLSVDDPDLQAAYKKIGEIQQKKNILRMLMKFCKEEKEAIQQLWSGGRQRNDHGVFPRFLELEAALKDQAYALNFQEPDKKSYRYLEVALPLIQENQKASLACQEKLKTCCTHLVSLGASESTDFKIQDLQTALEAAEKAYRKLEKLSKEFDKREIRKQVCKIPSQDEQTYDQFETYFTEISDVLVKFTQLREELIALDDTYLEPVAFWSMRATNPHVLYLESTRIKEVFDKLSLRFQRLKEPSLGAGYLIKHFELQKQALTAKNEEIKRLNKEMTAIFTNINKYATQAAEQDTCNSQEFIDAKSEVRQEELILLQKISSLKMEVQTGVRSKDAFAPLFFRCEPLQEEIKALAKKKTAYIDELDKAVKEAENLLTTLGGMESQLQGWISKLQSHVPQETLSGIGGRSPSQSKIPTSPQATKAAEGNGEHQEGVGEPQKNEDGDEEGVNAFVKINVDGDKDDDESKEGH
jgi:hypothetical protein